ncbi:TonB-dependent receptor [Halieaceae bacterium IMCC14734]|uniref:TonB-dependent receptor n=1 Tax=Candidatus Litorirhabdus singularis TaxID=2518993 RepID=A0ABT3TDC0_9GAMM|nr:TonB-dependent receptor [Candidatus Litorirhabdus singularis]MCX2980268.1 TonB-dependent receptor [Candidatus Litorirhabdus singularis]
MRRYHGHLPFISTLLAAAVHSQISFAQEGFLEEVIVTAEKRETTLQDTAIAVSAFTQGELDAGLITNNMDIQMSVPNMLMSKGFFTTANISIRGIGNNAVGSFTDAGTGVHFNGVYLNNARIFETEYFDTARVEVLRGPQGTLYGRNTTGGVINVISQKPTEEFGGDLQLQLGDYGHTKVKGALNIPITDNLWQRFSVFGLKRDGFVENIYDGEEIDDRSMWAIRSSTTLQMGENTDATLVINYFEEDSNRMRGAGTLCKKDNDGILGCLPGSLPNETTHGGAGITGQLIPLVGLITQTPYPEDDFANSINPADPRKANLDFTPQYEADETIVSLEINHDFGNMVLTSLTGYHESTLDARNDYDQTVASEPWPVTVTYPTGPDGFTTSDRATSNDRSYTTPEQWSQEFRLASNFDGDWNFLLGGFYLDYESTTAFYVYSAALELVGATLGTPEDQRVFHNDTAKYELTTSAIFGELYYDITDKLEMTLGLRYTDEEKEGQQRTIYLSFASDPNAEGGGYDLFKDDWQETTGKFNMNYHMNEDVMWFGTLARSYKSGGFNPISSDNDLLNPDLGGDPSLTSFDPEYINSIELGVKSRLFDNTLQANLTWFYYDYEGLQVAKIVNQTALNENIDTEVMGMEGEFIWAPTENWRLTANVAWLDSELGEYETFDPADPNQRGTTEGISSGGNFNTYVGAECPTGCSGIPVSVEGNSLPNAPEFSVNLQAAYSFNLNNGMTVDTMLMYYWQDEFYARIYNTVNDKLESWDVWNANAMLTSADDDWYAEVYVRNIKDDDNRTGQYLQDAAVGLYTNYQLMEPRTYGVTLGYRF